MNNTVIGAYVLPGDTVWLTKSLRRYYSLLTELVVPVPVDGRGWNGTTLPVDEALRMIRDVDTRSIARRVSGEWTDEDHPMSAESAQRQAALDELCGRVDWVIQLDNDELLPDPEALLAAIDEAEARGLSAVEWPMRVLYRRTRRSVFEVVSSDGQPRYEYPGPIAVKPSVHLMNARQTGAGFLRVTVRGDSRSLQLTRPAAPDEQRVALATHGQAIIHNSWARSPAEIRAKMSSWGHAGDFHRRRYYWTRWWPAPLTWRLQRDFHPFASGLWPRLARAAPTSETSG